VDRLLRDHVLVDLHSAMRQGVRASVEGYTLDQLEPLYGFARKTNLREAAHAMQQFSFALEMGQGGDDLSTLQDVIASYNAEDCLSTLHLRDWLEQRRTELEGTLGRTLSRPAPAEENTRAEERNSEVAAVAEALREGLPDDPQSDDPDQAGRRLLSHLLSWHWRERKSGFWDHFHAAEVAPSERRDDRLALGELQYEGVVGDTKQSWVHRYRFAEQDHGIRKLPGAVDPDTGKAATIFEVGPQYVDIKRGKRSKEPHPTALIPAPPIDTSVQEQSLLGLGRAVASSGAINTSNTVEQPGGHPLGYAAARALLLRQPPDVGQSLGAPLLGPDEDTVAGVVRLARGMAPGVLAVQGPPGSGKTHRAAATIAALLADGKRVGITAGSHQVIVSLLRKALEHAHAAGLAPAALHMAGKDRYADAESLPFDVGKNYPDIESALAAGSLQLVGGTPFAWARQGFAGRVDVLVVDEAGQISLANVLAASPAAERLLLFGDPAQLEQPQRGVHPPGADVSALEHLLGNHTLTLPEPLGVFLPETRRLHPDLCQFTSRVFYEGRLRPIAGLAGQRVIGPEPLSGSGLRFIPVEHTGNTHRSDEEVTVVQQLVQRLLTSGAHFTDSAGKQHPFEPRHVLVVAPYNAQVTALRRALPEEVRVGTVDKFQGQQAPLVIYSMTSSSGQEAPRGLEFLYSLNRLNVATSRAQALVALVASPELPRARCRTPRQMQLVNALCTYLELCHEAAPSTA
jgi:uncharacterized protein